MHEFLPQIIGAVADADILSQGPAVVPARARPRLHPGRVPGRGLPLRAQHGASVVPAQPRRQRRRHTVLRLHLRSRRREPGRPGRPARRPAGAAPVRRLADVLRLRRRPDARTCGRTSGSTRRSRRRCSTCRWAPSPAATRRRRCRSATCCGTSRGGSRPANASPRSWATRCCTCRSSLTTASALENQTPLWYYVLAEAERLMNGVTLGPTGGRIVGEVFIGLLQLDTELVPARAAALDARRCPARPPARSR